MPAGSQVQQRGHSSSQPSPWDKYDVSEGVEFSRARVGYELVDEKSVRDILQHASARRLRDKTGHLVGYSLTSLLQSIKKGTVFTVWTSNTVNGYNQRWYSGFHRLGSPMP